MSKAKLEPRAIAFWEVPIFTRTFTEFTETTRITGGLSKHRQKPYNAYYPNNEL